MDIFIRCPCLTFFHLGLPPIVDDLEPDVVFVAEEISIILDILALEEIGLERKRP